MAGGTAAQPALASELAAALAHRAGLIRAFVIADATSIGTIALWVSEDDAERGELRELTARLGRPETIGLEAPLLIDASLHAAQCEAR